MVRCGKYAAILIGPKEAVVMWDDDLQLLTERIGTLPPGFVVSDVCETTRSVSQSDFVPLTVEFFNKTIG